MSEEMDRKQHWEAIYQAKPPENVSWFQPKPTHSHSMIVQAAPSHQAHIVDIGSGATTLIGALLDDGYQRITAVDIAASALRTAQQQLGPRAPQVQWIEADVTRLNLPSDSVDVWHDRAVYHFLTRTADR